MPENELIIQNADIFLAGVSLSNIYINKDYLVSLDRDIKQSRHMLREALNEATRKQLTLKEDIWNTEVKNIKEFNELSKSHSAYHPITKREFIASCSLEDMEFDEAVISRDELDVIKNLKSDIDKIYGLKNFKIENIELKFYEYGNVIITGRIKIRNKKLSKEDYRKLSDFAHAFFGPALKDTASELVNIYIEVMKEIHKNKNIDYYLIKIPREIEIKETRSHTLNFAIRYHFIYDSSLRQNKHFMDYFHDILCGEWELNLQNTVSLSDASIYFGWTHSLIVLEDYVEKTSEKLYEKYKFPLEVVCANWGTLDLLSKGLDKARARFIQDIEYIEKSNFKKNDYVKLANNVREFTLKVERIIESFDSYTVSNNPMHYKLIDMQQEVWLEQKSIEKIRKKLALVSRIVDELSERQKSFESERINKVLITITFLSVLSIPKVIYDLATSSFQPMIIDIAIVLTFVIFIFTAYLFQFTRKSGK